MGSGSIEAKAVSIPTLIESTLQRFDRPVVDKTGLTGLYSFKVQWSTEDAVFGQQNTVLATASPAFFTALEEQLGLRLTSAKGPGEILVIESVHRPSEN